VCRLAFADWFAEAGAEADDFQSAHIMSGGSKQAIFNGFELRALREKGPKPEQLEQHESYCVVFEDVSSQQKEV
jgi:hypothetical protein